jgi:hypothetical protein
VDRIQQAHRDLHLAVEDPTATAYMLSVAVGSAAFVDQVLVAGLYASTTVMAPVPLAHALVQPPMTYSMLLTTAEGWYKTCGRH